MSTFFLLDTAKKRSRGKRAPNRANSLPPRANVALNKELMELPAEHPALLAFYTAHSQDFNHVNWGTMLSKLGRLPPHSIQGLLQDPVFTDLLESLTLHLSANIKPPSPDSPPSSLPPSSPSSLPPSSLPPPSSSSPYDSRTVSNIVHALGRLRHPYKPILDLVISNADWFTRDANPQAISQVCWAYAKLEYPSRSLFDTIDRPETARHLITTGAPQSVANASWSFATLNYPAPNLFELMNTPEIITSFKETASPQELSNMAWACATAGVDGRHLYDAIEEEAPRLIELGPPQAISNIAWALATSDYPALKFFAAVETNLWQLIDDSSTQEISSLIWSFAKLQIPTPGLFKKIEQRSQFLVANGTEQSISNTAWAFAKMNYDCAELFEEIDKKAKEIVKNGNPQSISNIAWALGTLQYDGQKFMNEVNNNSDWVGTANASTQAVANVALAFAELGIEGDKFFEKVEDEVEWFLREGKDQHISNLCWSLSILGLSAKRETLLQRLWDRLRIGGTGSEVFRTSDVLQLAQIKLHAEVSGVELAEVSPSIRAAIKEQVLRLVMNSSRSEEEWSSLLKSMGFEHEREVSAVGGDLEGFLSIDLACKKRRIAVECDGPSHFLKSLGSERLEGLEGGGRGGREGRENGQTVAKRRLLTQMGWKVVNIPYQHDRRMGTPEFAEIMNACVGSEEYYVQPESENGSHSTQVRDFKKKYLRDRMRDVGIHLKLERRPIARVPSL